MPKDICRCSKRERVGRVWDVEEVAEPSRIELSHSGINLYHFRNICGFTGDNVIQIMYFSC